MTWYFIIKNKQLIYYKKKITLPEVLPNAGNSLPLFYTEYICHLQKYYQTIL